MSVLVYRSCQVEDCSGRHVPGGACALDQEAPSDVNRGLHHSIVRVVEIWVTEGLCQLSGYVDHPGFVLLLLNLLDHMVGHPEPHVLKVARSRRRYMHHQTAAETPRVGTTCDRRALGRRQLRAGCAANSRMTVP